MKVELWHRVVAAASPGIAAQDAPDGQEQAFDRAVFENRLARILRTGRREAARWWRVGRDELLVEHDRLHQQPGQTMGNDMQQFPHLSLFKGSGGVVSSAVAAIFSWMRDSRLTTLLLTVAAVGIRRSIQMKAMASGHCATRPLLWR